MHSKLSSWLVILLGLVSIVCSMDDINPHPYQGQSVYTAVRPQPGDGSSNSELSWQKTPPKSFTPPHPGMKSQAGYTKLYKLAAETVLHLKHPQELVDWGHIAIKLESRRGAVGSLGHAKLARGKVHYDKKNSKYTFIGTIHHIVTDGNRVILKPIEVFNARGVEKYRGTYLGPISDRYADRQEIHAEAQRLVAKYPKYCKLPITANVPGLRTITKMVGKIQKSTPENPCINCDTFVEKLWRRIRKTGDARPSTPQPAPSRNKLPPGERLYID